MNKHNETCSSKPTIDELANILGISKSETIRIIHEFEIEELVNTSIDTNSFNEQVLNYIITLVDGLKIVKSDTSVLKGKELDVYIPEFSLAIQFNCTEDSSTIRNKSYHQTKTIDCARQGVRLIHIFEHEWKDTIKRCKIEELLKTILKPSSNRVLYARKTKLSEVEYKDTRAFLNNSHLQGEATASLNIGLHVDEELVALMTFGKPRFNSGYEWELVRLAYKSGTAVVGGAERMFKYFLGKCNPTSIISYCDISKFSGAVYKRLGFNVTSKDVTEPNYVWISSSTGDIIPRYKAMKHKLIAKGLGKQEQTEVEIMTNLGYNRVYDSGNLRFTWVRGEES